MIFQIWWLIESSNKRNSYFCYSYGNKVGTNCGRNIHCAVQKKDLALCTSKHLLTAWKHNTRMMPNHGRLSEKLGQKREAITTGKQDKTDIENYHWHCLFVSFFLSSCMSFFVDWFDCWRLNYLFEYFICELFQYHSTDQ